MEAKPFAAVLAAEVGPQADELVRFRARQSLPAPVLRHGEGLEFRDGQLAAFAQEIRRPCSP
jgi:hypothetical protein